MRNEYDFSQSRKNPYAKNLKRQVRIRLDIAAVDYFKKMAAELDIPYQNLINLYLRDCAAQKRKLAIQWPKPSAPSQRRDGSILPWPFPALQVGPLHIAGAVA